ncbi:hypothetical protein EZ449_19240 [Pedobacter frigidisoli]|uniref:Uncharacterized protein n=1 Tax=Pedobacter frigidisoli TaxID=2530455 RepID=A0A4R0NQW6_9SPHI|nr:hypothetical protein [Pedobacter frigidisoli]TCD02193.1 hypothetical protein EZ449_19240 [Pedobacter frigidisoli]
MILAKKFFLIIVFVALSSLSKADTGCRLSDGSIHGPQTGNALLGATLVPFSLGLVILYYNSPTVQTAVGSCPSFATGVTTTGRSCTTSALTILGLGLVAQNQGQEVSFNIFNCDLDHYVWVLGALAGILGAFFVKKEMF